MNSSLTSVCNIKKCYYNKPVVEKQYSCMDSAVLSYCRKYPYFLDPDMFLYSTGHQPDAFATSLQCMNMTVIRILHQSFMLLSEINQHPSSHSQTSVRCGHDIKV